MIIEGKRYEGIQVYRRRGGVQCYGIEFLQRNCGPKGDMTIPFSMFPLHNWVHEEGCEDPAPAILRCRVNGFYGFWATDEHTFSRNEWRAVSWKKVPEAWKPYLLGFAKDCFPHREELQRVS